MTDLQRERLQGLGVDIEETLERFVENEALFFRCLNKLEDDKNYSLLCEAIEEGTDAQKAFDAAHALKGVSANLGLNKLLLSFAKSRKYSGQAPWIMTRIILKGLRQLTLKLSPQ